MIDTQAFETALDNVQEIVEPTPEQIAQARRIISDPGMLVIWGMMLGVKQAKYVQLGNLPLGTPQSDWAAALVQGHIKGIDALRFTLLDLASMGSSPAAPTKEQK